MRKKIITLFLAVFCFLGLFASFYSANADASEPEKGVTVYLQQQENTEHTSIRYVATIENLLTTDELTGIDIHLTLSNGDDINKEADDPIDTIYTSVTDLKEEKLNTYYAIYTVTGIDKHNDCVMTAEMTLTFSDESILKSNKVSHNLTSDDYLDLEFVYNVLEGQSSAGNGQYLTKSLQEVYASSDSFVDTGITALYNSEIVTPSFDTTLFDAKESGECVVTANYNGESASFKVYKVDTPLSVVDRVGQVVVDQSYDGVIGANVDGYNVFTTLKQALDFLTIYSNECDSREIMVCEGYYNEKLDIALPNLTICGIGDVVIEYDSLYGTNDQLVFDNKGNRIAHTTDSTMTVAVRSTATNVKLMGVTISNWWNSEEHFNSKVTYLTNNGLYSAGKVTEHRALALLVQADQFVAESITLLGYQDTLELMTGRQYFDSCTISGATDFIFGTNNTTLFECCTIHSIYNGSTDGGYINAFKGQNKNESDAIEYGVIYNYCEFTCDVEVTSSNTAIARPWGQTSAVMVMNSDIGGHISTVAHTEGTTKNERYVTMSGCEPTLSTVKFYEFGNIGDGAIEESINGCTVFTDEADANAFEDYTVIFGKVNGGVNYSLAWDPINGLESDTNTYYNFNNSTETTGTNYDINEAFTSISKGSSEVIGDMIIDCTNGNAAWNESSGHWNFKPGVKIYISCFAGSLITIKAYSNNYANFNIDGVGTTSDTLCKYVPIDDLVEIDITGDTYIRQIVITPEVEAPATPVLQSLSVSGAPTTDFQVGDAYDLSSIVVKAIYSNNTYVTLTSSDYTIDETEIDINTAGTYYATVTYEDATYDIKLVYVSNYDPRVTEACTWSFRDNPSDAADDYFVWDSKASEFSKLQLSGAYADNGNYIKFNTGATAAFTVADACTVGVCYYQHISCIVYIDGEAVATSDAWTSETTYINYVIPHGGLVEIIATSEYNGNSYLTFINVSNFVPTISETTGYNFKGGAYSGTNVINVNNEETFKLQNTDEATYANVTFNGCVSNGTDNWLSFNTGATITFNVAGPCTLNICFYNGQNNATVTLNGEEVATATSSAGADYATKYEYEITEAGQVVITSNANGYIGFFEVVFD